MVRVPFNSATAFGGGREIAYGSQAIVPERPRVHARQPPELSLVRRHHEVGLPVGGVGGPAREGVEPVRIEGHRHRAGPDEVAHEAGGLLVAREARTDRERVRALERLEHGGERSGRHRPGGRFGERREHGFDAGSLHHGQDRRGDGHHDQSGTDPGGGAGDQGGGAGHRTRTRDHHHHARGSLVGVGGAGWQGRGDIAGFDQERRRIHRPVGEADVDHPHGARALGAGQEHDAHLGGPEGHRELGLHGVTVDRARRRRRPPTGCRRRSPAPRPAFSPSIAAAHSSSGTPRKPVPKIASIATSARASSAARPAGLNARPVSPCSPRRPALEAAGSRSSSSASTAIDAHAHAPACQVPRRDQSVATVVALAAHHHRATAVHPAAPIDRGLRHRATRALHQDVGGRSRRLRRPVQVVRLLRGEDRLHDVSSCTAIAKATAFVFSWVNVTMTRVMPCASARRFALPVSAMLGAPLGWRVTLMSCQPRPR